MKHEEIAAALLTISRGFESLAKAIQPDTAQSPILPSADNDVLLHEFVPEINSGPLGARIYNVLRNNGINTRGQLRRQSKNDLGRLKNLGHESVNAIIKYFARLDSEAMNGAR